MISDRIIIAIASDWDFDPTGKHHIMKILSQRNHVVWVNYHGSRRPQASAADALAIVNKLKQVARGSQRVSETMQVVTPLVIPMPGSSWARIINQKLVVRQIRAALGKCPKLPVQLWTFAPDVDYLIGRFGEELDLYYCVDEFSEFSRYDSATIRSLERDLIGKSDLVITTAGHLQESKRALHPHTYLVPHGVSYDHFAKATAETTEIPDDIAGLRAPIFGFFGMIQDWIDLDLIVELARRRPEWSFVMIGKQEVDVDLCNTVANIHLPGQVPFASLPGYCKAFDVGLIPFKVNPLTVNVNPIKLREYLAAGLPVVSTDLPEVRRYQPHVHIGRSVDEFERACRKALQERGPHFQILRQSAVENETWQAKVEQLSGLAVRALQRKGARTFQRSANQQESADTTAPNAHLIDR